VLAETVLILANHEILAEPWNTKLLYFLTGATSPDFLATSFSLILPLGALVALAGAALRTSAFHALGRHFTFELALRKDHQLVTSFPYSLVRHPGYLGGWIAIAGFGLVLTPRDGWVRAALVPRLALGSYDVATRLAVAAVAGAFTLMGAMSLSRVSVEDAMLRERFGREWDEWARRVPWNMVPYVW
jgi:protein-S-isoprenylcysteine O-methyltransferase Ste14